MLEKMDFPEPVISIAIEPKTKADEEKLGASLQKMALEDPSFRVSVNEDTGQTLISGMGELHLEIIVDRLTREHRVEANVGKPQVAYKEGILQSSLGSSLVDRNLGGKSQFGQVSLALSPCGRGEGNKIEILLPKKALPQEFERAILKTLNECLSAGNLAGFPLVDMHVVLKSAEYRELDSNELAYQSAASNAFKEALEAARPQLLEPLMRVQILVPEANTGDVIQDLNARRGRIVSMDPRPGAWQAINAEMPLATMFGYSTHLRSRSQGRGTFTMEFDRYEQMPPSVEKEVLTRITGLSF